jgi:hypothetical protein
LYTARPRVVTWLTMGLISAEAWRGCRGALNGLDAVQAETQLTDKVIAVMVGRGGTLVEMQAPKRHEGEEWHWQYQVRKAQERGLIINPNYHLEEPEGNKYVGERISAYGPGAFVAAMP